MKKVFNQLKVTLSLIVVLVLILSCGTLTCMEAKHIISNFERKHSDARSISWDMYDYYNCGEKIYDDISFGGNVPVSKKGIGIIPAFYISHKENHYNSSDVGFYSMLQNSEGEIVAEYQPYILFEKNAQDKRKDDIRVLVLGDEFSEAYDVGELETEKDRYNFDARDILEDICVYGEKSADWDNTPDCLKVDGTCDDDIVYLEKLTWCDSYLSKTYTYSPEEKQTHKGTADFEKWLDYKRNDVEIDVSDDVRYLVNTNLKYVQEAKEICEQNLVSYKQNPSSNDDFSAGLLTTIAKDTSYIRGDNGNTEGDYLFTATYVIHPLKEAVDSLIYMYLLALLIAMILVVLINLLFNKKRKLLEASYAPIEKQQM